MRTDAVVVALLVLLSIAPAGATAAKPHDMATIAAPTGTFRIDRHEVTIGQFRVFANATGIKTEAEADGGGHQFRGSWQIMPGWTWATPYGRAAHDDEPAVHITFTEARAYCAWAGLRLPSDAEWVAAAYTERQVDPSKPFKTGTTYPYPTGDQPDGANQLDNKLLAAGPLPTADLGQGRGHVRVRVTPPGVNGLWDMGGNVWEWVEHGEGGHRRTRGGSWWYGPAQMRADAATDKAVDFAAVYIGFRCAAAP